MFAKKEARAEGLAEGYSNLAGQLKELGVSEDVIERALAAVSS